VVEAVKEALEWLEEKGSQEDSDPEDINERRKELEDVVQPIMAKLYQGAGPKGGEDSSDSHDEL
jgi:endoplasmic reticulum chaperone BiP